MNYPNWRDLQGLASPNSARLSESEERIRWLEVPHLEPLGKPVDGKV